MRLLTITIILAAFQGFAAPVLSPAWAGDLTGEVADIRHQLCVIRYTLQNENEQLEALDELVKPTDDLVAMHPGMAEPLLAKAAVLATKAEIVNGMSVLGDAEKARDLALQAEKINPGVMGGVAAGILGSLYHGVPGWPIGFGDDVKAAKWFMKAREDGPGNINTNYYYADFLLDKGRGAEAAPLIDEALTQLRQTPKDEVRDGKIRAFDALAARLGK